MSAYPFFIFDLKSSELQTLFATSRIIVWNRIGTLLLYSVTVDKGAGWCFALLFCSTCRGGERRQPKKNLFTFLVRFLAFGCGALQRDWLGERLEGDREGVWRVSNDFD